MSLVYAKNKRNGVTYVYESTGYWDKEKQQSRNKRVCIGKLDPDTGGIIYSKRLQENFELPRVKPGPIPVTECRRSFFGATYLFDAIGEKLGITDDLAKCFPDIYKSILSIAYYLILEDRNPLSRFPKWAATHTPLMEQTSLPREAVNSLDPSQKMRKNVFSSFRENAAWRRSSSPTIQHPYLLIRNRSSK